MSNKTSRRKVLSGLTVGAATALAGCSGIFDGNGNGNGGMDPADFNYPEGFSQEGIDDFETALGTGSAHYQSDSFQFNSSYNFERPDGSTQELTAESQVSGVDEQQYYRSENQSSIQEQYHNGETVYLRLYSKQQEQAQYQVQQAQFNKEGAYLLTLFQNQVQGMSFSVDEVVSEDQVRYIATLDSIPEDHFIYQQYNNLTEFQLLLTVDVDGLVRSVEVDLSREAGTQTEGDTSGDTAEDSTSDEDTSGEDSNIINESYTFEFSNHGEVTVEEPEWTSEAEAAQEERSGGGTSGDGTSGDGTTSDGTSSDDTTNSIRPAGF